MSENEINDNLMMLKYFLQEEGDENWKDYCNAIQGLLDLYNKEKEKNESVEAQRLRDMCYKTDANYISKDKIKEQLNELDNMKVDGEVFTTAVNFAKKILQELLEERNFNNK